MTHTENKNTTAYWWTLRVPLDASANQYCRSSYCVYTQRIAQLLLYTAAITGMSVPAIRHLKPNELNMVLHLSLVNIWGDTGIFNGDLGVKWCCDNSNLPLMNSFIRLGHVSEWFIVNLSLLQKTSLGTLKDYPKLRQTTELFAVKTTSENSPHRLHECTKLNRQRRESQDYKRRNDLCEGVYFTTITNTWSERILRIISVTRS